ncbi:MAG: hypothetical protein HN821_02500 [Rhodospirillaceae bacterium]|nr:hypothetical protein [Rhodospirillaceae bacterium]
MTSHRYTPRALNADLLRAGIGLFCCLVPLAAVDFGTVMTLVFAIPAALFAIFGLRTWRHRSVTVHLDADGISTEGPGATRIAWRDLGGLKLSYFSTRRDREPGWMQLKLRSQNGTIALNSALEDFDDICRATFEAARSFDIEMTDASARNFAALGLGAIAPDHEPTPAALTGWGNPADWRR